MPKRPAHDDARMHGGAIERAHKQLFERQDPMAAVKKETCEDFVAVATQPRLDVAPGVGGRGERPAVAVQPRLHPPGVDFEHRMDPRPVLVGQEYGTEHIVGIVEEPAQAASGGERGGIDVDSEEAEQLMVVEGGGSRAPDAGEQRLGRCRCWARRGMGGGGLVAHGGGECGFVGHDGSIVGKGGSGPEALFHPPGPCPSDAPLRLANGEAAWRGRYVSGGACRVPVWSAPGRIARWGRVRRTAGRLRSYAARSIRSGPGGRGGVSVAGRGRCCRCVRSGWCAW